MITSRLIAGNFTEGQVTIAGSGDPAAETMAVFVVKEGQPVAVAKVDKTALHRLACELIAYLSKDINAALTEAQAIQIAALKQPADGAEPAVNEKPKPPIGFGSGASDPAVNPPSSPAETPKPAPDESVNPDTSTPPEGRTKKPSKKR